MDPEFVSVRLTTMMRPVSHQQFCLLLQTTGGHLPSGDEEGLIDRMQCPDKNLMSGRFVSGTIRADHREIDTSLFSAGPDFAENRRVNHPVIPDPGC